MTKQWKSFDDLEQTPEFQAQLHREFPEDASIFESDVSRRKVLKLMGASLALAGVAGCSIRKPVQHAYPYAKRPEYDKPGQSMYIATAMSIGDDVVGLLAKSQEGRPTKIEGNPGFSKNSGATTGFHQASILNLYDPDRLKQVQYKQSNSDLASFKSWVESFHSSAISNQGEGVALLIEAQVSPTFYRLLDSFLLRYPKARVFRYEPVSSDNLTEGLRMVTKQFLSCEYRFDKADVIVSFDSDFLGSMADQSFHTRSFLKRRDPDQDDLNRLYCFESNYTLTGGKADHRYPVSSSSMTSLLCRFITFLVDKGLVKMPKMLYQEVVRQASLAKGIVDDHVLSEIAHDFLGKRSLIVAGDHQPPLVHALVFYVNQLLGNVNQSLVFKKLAFSNYTFNRFSSKDSIQSLVDSIRADQINTLFVMGGNPVYNAPVDLEISTSFSKLNAMVHLTDSINETSGFADYVIPRSHYLESWSDLVAKDGSQVIVQPAVRPLYQSVSDLEFLLLLLRRKSSGYASVRRTFRGYYGRLNFEQKWRKWLHQGFVNPPLKGGLSPVFYLTNLKRQFQGVVSKPKKGFLELVFSSASSQYDGRFSNNGWLQEVPDFMTKLTWDNAALVSVATAEKYHLKTEQLVDINLDGRVLTCPICVLPGHADDSITLHLGYGRTVCGRVGENKGFNAYLLRSMASFDLGSKVTIAQRQETYPLACTQDHWSMEGRPHVRYASISKYKKKPSFAKDMVHTMPLKSLFEEKKYDEGYQWGMTIDLSKCTGCNACIVACQAENNIPIVGKEEVINGREMHWLRIDRYFEGDVASPKALAQPVTCMHCENAPCEQVCPVAATVHDDEGLNAMVYNRCVGTRYCADNCPAKVRRFNFFDYHQTNPQAQVKQKKHFFDYIKEPDPSVQMQFNPDVTVRMRGVMEKCTYCVQRISSAKAVAKNEGRLVQDGEIQTACQQACAADGVSFGNILDKNSQVAKDKKKARNYEILNELHLAARTSYLALVTNPNPKLVAEEEDIDHGHH